MTFKFAEMIIEFFLRKKLDDSRERKKISRVTPVDAMPLTQHAIARHVSIGRIVFLLKKKNS